MNKKIIGAFILSVFMCTGVFAQGAKTLKINEILVQNDSNYMDNYGVRSGWIEIFNTSFAPVDIRSCYLVMTNPNMKDTIRYTIPKGDVLTKIEPRQHLLFWADGHPNKGTFHVNFELDPTVPNWIALYNANGRDLIDSITVPANMGSNISWARKIDGIVGDNAWELRGISPEKYVTPSTNNITLDSNEKIEKFEKMDNYGYGMSIMAMSVVFSGLLLLFISFFFIGKISVKLSRRNAMKAQGITHDEAKEKSLGKVSGEVYAAISMAIHEYQNVHDVENTVLTINQVQRRYSPWSSKIYSLRETPKR